MKKRKKYRILVVLLCVGIIVNGCGQGTIKFGKNNSSIGQGQEYNGIATGTTDIIFMGTADDADCTILQVKEDGDTKTVMIDTGEDKDISHLQELLEEYQIKQLDLLIITHPDKDHIGGIQTVVSSVTIKEVVIPYYSEQNEKYMRLLKRIIPIKNQVTVLTENTTRQYGGLLISLYVPKKTYYKKDNNYSIATLAQYGQTKMFFAGDAMKERTRELLQEVLPEVDLYKMAYHGREYKDFDKLYWTLNPDYTVITAKEAEDDVVDVLKESQTQILYTRNQDITFETDGIHLNIS